MCRNVRDALGTHILTQIYSICTTCVCVFILFVRELRCATIGHEFKQKVFDPFAHIDLSANNVNRKRMNERMNEIHPPSIDRMMA